MRIRTRFAPSPTGYLHIGNIRTALYSWLFTRNHGGKFILRIEDTDLKRSMPESIQSIINSMNWLNLEWDEGPYFQSQRFDRYNAVINEMLRTGKAYKCYCSKERLDSIRKEQIAKGEKPKYDNYCRYNREYHSNDEPYVIRFSNPNEGSVIFDDQIRGLIEFSNHELDDLVIRRTDGTPTYNFCVVIDDWDMKITHVIRGEEHINNTPRQINMLKALNAPIPIYAHISMIHGSDGKKFSKRHGAINVMQYREDGYLPDALLNYLVRLGWSNGNQEIFTREEMIKLFSLKAVNRSASIFNNNKLLWLNHHYINTLPSAYVTMHLKWHIKKIGIDIRNGPKLSEIIRLLGKRCKTLKEIAERCRYFYEDFSELNIDKKQKCFLTMASHPLEVVRDKISSISVWNENNIHQAIQSTANELKIDIKEVRMPLRIALTGVENTPALDVIIHAIGKERSIMRINKTLDLIADNKNTL